MDSHKISDRISRNDKIDKWAIPVHDWLAGLFETENGLASKTEDFLHGKWLGHPLHPILIHIPVGCWTAAAIMDLFSAMPGARMAAVWAISIGLLSAIPAAIAGIADWARYDDPSVRRIGLLHMALNALAFLFYLLSDALRYGTALFPQLLFGYLGFACLVVSGYLGGVMLFEKRIGVNHAVETSDHAAPDEFVTVASLSELSLNHPTKVQIGDTFAVLIRTAERVYALAEKCAHENGPLSQGTVVDDCLMCPIHCTKYRLETGEVVTGPGIYSQPVFEVYLRGDEVRVKAIRVDEPEIASAPISKAVSVM